MTGDRDSHWRYSCRVLLTLAVLVSLPLAFAGGVAAAPAADASGDDADDAATAGDTIVGVEDGCVYYKRHTQRQDVYCFDDGADGDAAGQEASVTGDHFIVGYEDGCVYYMRHTQKQDVHCFE